jgi:hypothetical protein
MEILALLLPVLIQYVAPELAMLIAALLHNLTAGLTQTEQERFVLSVRDIIAGIYANDAIPREDKTRWVADAIRQLGLDKGLVLSDAKIAAFVAMASELEAPVAVVPV